MSLFCSLLYQMYILQRGINHFPLNHSHVIWWEVALPEARNSNITEATSLGLLDLDTYCLQNTSNLASVLYIRIPHIWSYSDSRKRGIHRFITHSILAWTKHLHLHRFEMLEWFLFVPYMQKLLQCEEGTDK